MLEKIIREDKGIYRLVIQIIKVKFNTKLSNDFFYVDDSYIAVSLSLPFIYVSLFFYDTFYSLFLCCFLLSIIYIAYYFLPSSSSISLTLTLIFMLLFPRLLFCFVYLSLSLLYLTPFLLSLAYTI